MHSFGQKQHPPHGRESAAPARCNQTAPGLLHHAQPIQYWLRPLADRAVQFQRKLAVNAPGDACEQEADRIAHEVMRIPELHAGPGDHGAAPSRAPTAIQRVAANGAGDAPVPASVEDVLRSSGQPLDEGTRRFMEPRLGHDLAHVRVHTDDRAMRSAREVDALAYTVGSHVVFQQGTYDPGTRAGKRLLAHELAHVVQQGAAPGGAASARAAAGPGILQRQQDPDAGPPASAPPAPSTGGAGTAPPATPGAGGTAVATGTPAPASAWSPDVPYIWFDLHDIYRALTEPAGPYLYSAYVWKDRAQNQNFASHLNPAPARDTTARMPGGFRANPSDLLWFFYTKFFVDSAAAPLPPAYTSFETSATIRFTPVAGGTGWQDQFVDNSPRYTSPGGLSYPFALGTTPYGFRAQRNIMEPGVLQWDARLRVSQGDSSVPLRLQYSAPPQFPDEAAFRADLAEMGLRVREPAPGEPARTCRVTFTDHGAGRFSGTMEMMSADGTLLWTRRIPTLNEPPSAVVDAMSLVLALSLGVTSARFGSSSEAHVEIRGSQRVRFERPATNP